MADAQRRSLCKQRTMIWMALRNLMLQAENNEGVLTRAQADAFDHLFVDLKVIDAQLQNLEPVFPPALAPAPDTCPCGYDSECAIWCGDGHETGKCAHVSAMGLLREEKRRMRQMDSDYEFYKELYANSGEQDYYDKMLECVYIT